MVETAPVQVITNEQDKQFDYDLVQLEYLKACSEYFTNPKNITGPWTHAAKCDIIDSVKSGKQAAISIYNLSPNFLSICQPVLENGEDILVVRDTALEFLSYEESFDVFVDLHKMTGHGDTEAMKALLTVNFYISNKCLEYFIANCNVCKKFRRKVNPVVFNDHVIVDIHEAPHADESCKYVLYYVDLVTKFKLFKPLTSFCEDEVAIEMLKIFTDFGPPRSIETVHIQLFTNVLSILACGELKYTISLYKSKQVAGTQIIKKYEHQCVHWSTMCKLTQFNHNKKHNKQVKSPIAEIFWLYDKTRLYSKTLNRETLQNRTNINSIINSEVESEGEDCQLILNQKENSVLPSEVETECKMDNLETIDLIDDACKTDHITEKLPEDTCVLEYCVQPTAGQIIAEKCPDVNSISEHSTEPTADKDTSEKSLDITCLSDYNTEPTGDQDIAEKTPDVTCVSENIETIDLIDHENEIDCITGESPGDTCLSEYSIEPTTDKDIAEKSLDKTYMLEYNIEPTTDQGIAEKSLDIIEKSLNDTCISEHNTESTADMDIIENIIIKDEVTIEEETMLIRPIENLEHSHLKEEDILDDERTMTASSQYSDTTMPESSDILCAICNGKMLTDYFCFNCTKPTHIFCMQRVLNPIENRSEPIVSFTFCQSCCKLLEFRITEECEN